MKLKVQVTYQNTKTGRIGKPVHNIPGYLSYRSSAYRDNLIEEYLKDEVRSWNRDNVLISWERVTHETTLHTTNSQETQRRRDEIQNKWKPQLKAICNDACKRLNTKYDCSKYVIKYYPTKSGYASINDYWRKIYIGQKFFVLSEEDKYEALIHEFSHPILKYSTHSSSMKQRLTSANIMVGIPTKYIEHKYKYEIYCPKCNKVLDRKQQRCEMVNNPERWRHKTCGTNLKSRRIK